MRSIDNNGVEWDAPHHQLPRKCVPKQHQNMPGGILFTKICAPATTFPPLKVCYPLLPVRSNLLPFLLRLPIPVICLINLSIISHNNHTESIIATWQILRVCVWVSGLKHGGSRLTNLSSTTQLARVLPSVDNYRSWWRSQNKKGSQSRKRKDTRENFFVPSVA